MAAQKGSALLLKATLSGTESTVAGLRSTSMTINGEMVDITTKDSDALVSGGVTKARDLLEGGGVSNMAISASGVFTDEAADAYAFNAAYTADSYGVSLTYSVVENAGLTNEDTYTAANAYYTPDGSLPSISVGYEIGDLGGAVSSNDEKTSFFVGLSWDEVGPGTAGVAVGHSNTIEGTDEAYQYEAYYSYDINDGMTITPLIFTKDNVTSGLDDTTGVMVKTSFSF